MKFQSDHTLRTHLREATKEVTDASKHPALIAQVGLKHPHSVRVVASHDPLMPKASDADFTCFAFALNLADAPGYRKIRSHFKNTNTANSEFVEWLIAEARLEEVEGRATRDGDLIVYFDSEGEPTHAGVLRGDEVVSKWGTGKLLVHPLGEVPVTYGDECRFYRAISAEVADSTFVEYSGIDLWRIPALPNSA